MTSFLFFILLFPFLLSAQDPVIDSLKLALKNAKHDTTRVLLLTELSEICEIEDILKYANPCVKICEEKVTPNNKNTGNLQHFYLKHLASALNNIGIVYDNTGEITLALEYYKKSLSIEEKIKNKSGTASSLNNIGYVYDNLGDISNALNYFHKSLKISEEIDDKKGTALTLNNIGAIFQYQGDIVKAMEYYNKSLKYNATIGNKKGAAGTLINIGLIYHNQHNLEQAKYYFNKSLKLEEEINNKAGIAYCLNNIGVAYIDEENYPTALDFLQKSLKIREDIGDKKGIIYSLIAMAEVHLKSGDIKSAFKYSNRSMQLSNELGSPNNIKRAATSLKIIYKKQNKHKEAFEMYELEIQMSDRINNTETKKASIKKQFQYQYEKKAAADSVKNAEEQKVKNAQLTAQHAQLKQEKTQRFALYGGLFLVIAFLGFVFNRFRVTQKQKGIIEQQKVLVDEAFTHLEEKNKEVTDSIHYAKRIQTALLTSEKYIERKLNELN